ncbi:hypothetical protein [Streptomyces sp. NBC_01718]
MRDARFLAFHEQPHVTVCRFCTAVTGAIARASANWAASTTATCL